MTDEWFHLKVVTDKGTFYGGFQQTGRIPTWHAALEYTLRFFSTIGLEITDVARRKRGGGEWGESFTLFDQSEHPACGEAIWKAAGKGTEFNVAMAMVEAENAAFFGDAEDRAIAQKARERKMIS